MTALPAPTVFVPNPPEAYETEFALPKLHSRLFALSSQLKAADVLPPLKALHARDPDHAKRV